MSRSPQKVPETGLRFVPGIVFSAKDLRGFRITFFSAAAEAGF